MEKILENLLTDIIRKEYFTDQVLRVRDNEGGIRNDTTDSPAFKIFHNILSNNSNSIKENIYPLIEKRLEALIKKGELDYDIKKSYVANIMKKESYYQDSKLDQITKDLPQQIASEIIKANPDSFKQKINYKGLTEAIENGTLKVNITIS